MARRRESRATAAATQQQRYREWLRVGRLCAYEANRGARWAAGMRWDCERCRLYLVVLDRMPRRLDVTAQAPHGALFFFSSRRRHTRCLSDWSSDVCSSDLRDANAHFHRRRKELPCGRAYRSLDRESRRTELDVITALGFEQNTIAEHSRESRRMQIGRASCRERV